MRNILSSALLAGCLAVPALADGNALIIRNAEVGGGVLSGSDESGVIVEALRENGFDVVSGEALNAAKMRNVFVRFLDGREDPNATLVVVLTGGFVHSAAGAYLLPAESDGADDVTPGAVLAGALPVDLVMAALATVPGRAVLVLGEAALDMAETAYFRPGLGVLDIPQGVTVIRGPSSEVARFTADHLSRNEHALGRAAARLGLVMEGYAPAGFRLSFPEPVAEPPAPDPAPQDQDAPAYDRAADEAAWRLAQAADTAEGYRTYLEGFAEGAFAAAARQRLNAIETDPLYRARRGEETLELSRDQRREIQRDLTVLGYNTRGVDGIFGQGTRRAIRDWQAATGLRESGYLNQIQIARLDNQATRRAAELEEEARQRQEEERRQDRALWQEVEGRGDEEGLRTYLERFPEGLFAERAQELLATLEARRADRAAARDRRNWDRAREADTIAGYQAYLENFPQGAFAAEANARIAELRRAAQNADAVARARAAEEALGLNPVARRLAETRLAQLGLEPGAVDGTFDERTRRAIRQFQQYRNIAVTGYIDQETVAWLLAGGLLRSD